MKLLFINGVNLNMTGEREKSVYGGQTLAEMALAWVLRDTRVTSVIIGCSSKEQLMDCIGTVGSPEFTTAELEEIDSIGARIRPLV